MQVTTLDCYHYTHSSLLTSFQGSVDQICCWSTSLTVTGTDGAIVGGGWCEPSQCEGACYCVLHGNAAPTTRHRDTREKVASDHPIALSRGRRRPGECHVSCPMSSDCESFWWTSWDWECKEQCLTNCHNS